MRARLEMPLSEIIKNHPFKVVHSQSEFVTIEISDTEFNTAVMDIQNRLKPKTKNGIYSSVFINQLARHHLKIYEKFGEEVINYHVPSILDTIETFENGYPVNLRPFNGPLLKGLQHIHHNSETFVIANFENFWKAKKRGKDEITYQNQLLDETYQELLKITSPDVAEKKALAVLLNNLLTQSQYRAFKERTGEWIVLAQWSGLNYYLCLANHNETKPNNDDVILNRIQSCFSEFPELNQLFKNR